MSLNNDLEKYVDLKKKKITNVNMIFLITSITMQQKWVSYEKTEKKAIDSQSTWKGDPTTTSTHCVYHPIRLTDSTDGQKITHLAKTEQCYVPLLVQIPGKSIEVQ